MEEAGKKLISIIIPTYNSATTIIQAIESVLNQTFTSFEIIVVDDGSTDATKALLAPYIEKRLITYRHQENRGCGAARNAGIEIATGEYIALLDADDYWHPDKLQRQVAMFEKHADAVVCYTEAVLVDEQGQLLHPKRNRYSTQRNGMVTRFFAFHNIVTLSSAMIKAERLRQIGGFTDAYHLMMVADLDLWLRLAPLGPFYATDEPLTYYRIRSAISDKAVLKNYAQVAEVFKNNATRAAGMPKFWYIFGWMRVVVISFFYRFRIFRTIRHIGVSGIVKELYRRIRLHVEWIYYPAIAKRLNALHRSPTPTDEELLDFIRHRSWSVLVLGQIDSEIRTFLPIARAVQPKHILEIGTANGGNLFLLANITNPEGKVMSIDLPGGDFGGGYFARKQSLFKRFAGAGRSVTLIRGNSHDLASLEKIETVLANDNIDLLFIDGDHTYDGVKSDFAMYRPLVRTGGIVAFHDIANPPAENYGVKKFWDEIKNAYEYREIIADPQQRGYGIGVLYIP